MRPRLRAPLSWAPLFALPAFVAIVGCARRSAPAPSRSHASDASTEAAELHLEGVVRVSDPAQGTTGKPFRGVWLEVSGGKKWVVQYGLDAFWRALDGRSVVVEGVRWTPPGQALVADHVRVDRLRVADTDPHDAPFVEAGPEETVEGRFDVYTWPEGTKLAGEHAPVFAAADGTLYFLANDATEPHSATTRRVRARKVEQSPYVARPGGPYLWVLGPE